MGGGKLPLRIFPPPPPDLHISKQEKTKKGYEVSTATSPLETTTEFPVIPRVVLHQVFCQFPHLPTHLNLIQTYRDIPWRGDWTSFLHVYLNDPGLLRFLHKNAHLLHLKFSYPKLDPPGLNSVPLGNIPAIRNLNNYFLFHRMKN